MRRRFVPGRGVVKLTKIQRPSQFDGPAHAAEFLLLLIDGGLDEMATSRRKHLPMEAKPEMRARLVRVAQKLLVLRALDCLRWIDFPPQLSYLDAVNDQWVKGPYTIFQALHHLWHLGFAEPSKIRRVTSRGRFGSIPYLGDSLEDRAFSESQITWNDEVLLAPEGMIASLVAAIGTLSLGDDLGAIIGKLHTFDETGDAPEHRLCLMGLGDDREAMLLSTSGGGSAIASLRAANLPEHSLFRIIGSQVRWLCADEESARVLRWRLIVHLAESAKSARELPNLLAMVTVMPSHAFLPEGPRQEYKATYEADSRTSTKNPHNRLACLKTICGFLNAEGGTLTIGVTDEGEVLGLGADFALINDDAKADTFELRLREAMKNQLDPLPLNLVEVAFPEAFGRTICEVRVAKASSPTYLSYKDLKSGEAKRELFVRDGNRTIALRGSHLEQFLAGNWDGSTQETSSDET